MYREHGAGSSNHPTALSTNFCQFLSKFYLCDFGRISYTKNVAELYPHIEPNLQLNVYCFIFSW